MYVIFIINKMLTTSSLSKFAYYYIPIERNKKMNKKRLEMFIPKKERASYLTFNSISNQMINSNRNEIKHDLLIYRFIAMPLTSILNLDQ